jgi:hypothetical protein
MADLIINKENLQSAERLYAHPEATEEERQQVEFALSDYYANMRNMEPEAIQEQLGNLRYEEITGYGSATNYVEPESDVGQIMGSMAGALLGETRGARIGGAGGTVIGGMLGGPPGAVMGQRVGTVGGAIVGSGLGAFAGGSTGDLTQQLASNALNNKTFSASIDEVLSAGGEEAFYDVIGQVMFRGIPSAYRAGKGFLGRGKSESLEEMNKILKQKDTYPSLDQMTDNVIITTMGQVLRSLPVTNKSFQQLDATQSEAFVEYFQQQSKDWADLTTKQLTPQGFGRVVANVLKDGEAVFDESMRGAWQQFDDLSEQLFKTKQVNLDAVTRSGARTTAQKTVVYSPVNVSSIRKNAAEMLNEAKNEIGSVDPRSSGIGILESISKGANNLTFSQAHTLLSDLKRLQRTGRTEGLPSSVVVKDLIGDLDKAFNKAGEGFEDSGILKMYNNLRRQTKLGKGRFNADFIQEIMKNDKDGTKISAILTKATPEEINQLRKGIYYADSIAKKATGTSWKKIQSGYLARFMPTNVLNIDKSPIMKIVNSGDQQQLDRLTTVLGKEQVDNLVKSFSVINDLRIKPIFGASVGQGMAVAGSVAGAAGAGYLGGMEGALAATLAPKVLSSVFTSKKMSNKFYSLLTQAKKAKTFNPVNKANAYVRIGRLSYELAQEALSEE